MAGLGLVSPGVKVKEVDLTRGGITGVSDQTGAIAGPFVKGPVEDPQLIESEKDLVETFGEPQETSSQYEYWLSAASYLSYGGVLRVVRTDGTSLNNANAAVASGAGSSLSSLKIKNTEDYYNAYESATTWYYAAKNPGTWANGLKVCTIDSIADQVLSGIDTAGVVVGAGITQSFGGVTVGGIGTSVTLNGHLSGTVTGVGAGSVNVKVVSAVAVGGSVTAQDYEKGSAYEFKTTRDVIIAGATGAASTSIQVTRSVAGTNQSAITVGEAITLLNKTATTTIDNAGGAAFGVSENSVNVASVTGITANVSKLLIGGELMQVGGISGNVLTISSRGIGGTTATAHNDGSTITVVTQQAGAATTVAASNSGANDGNIVVNALGGIDVGDLVVVAGVGTAAETMTVTGITTNSALQPTTADDWYDSQTLGLDNATVYWKSIAPKPQTSAYANSRSSRFDEMHVVVVDDSGKETGTAGQILETWVNLSKAEDAKQFNSPVYYKNFLADNSEYIFAGAKPNGTPLTGTNNAANIAAGAWGQVTQGVSFVGVGKSTFSLEGGKDYGGTFTAPTYPTTLGDIISGYNQFTNIREYPINYLIMGPGMGSREETVGKANKLISIASDRKDCIAVVGPSKSDVLSGAGVAPVPITNSDTQTTNILTTCNQYTSSSYAVIDSGYKYIFDRFNNKFRYIPTNSDVAGMMARTSQNSFPWFSPAGADRGVVNNAVKLAYNPSQAQRDLLYTKRINPVVAFPGQGIILFGDKTALGFVSAFDRINVRRLFLNVETAIERAARAQLFEFNDDITRANFVNIVEPFLRDVQAKRGITDFLVVCDESNNTADIIDANEFRADIFIKPARSINFIGLTFVATRTGISFEEVVGTV